MNNIVNKIVVQLKFFLRPLAVRIFSGRAKELLLLVNNRFNRYAYKKMILSYYDKQDDGKIDTETQEVLDYLKSNDVSLFPYDFTEKYKPEEVAVFLDEKNGLKYTLLDGKKLYFKRGCDTDRIKQIFSDLLLAQDEKSPHCYRDTGFEVVDGDIVADIGAAEGDFSLSIIENVKKLYLFESDPELIEALRATFAPWKEKVEIVCKYVSDEVLDNSETLDNFFKDREAPGYLKIDVEGAEYKVLSGAKSLLNNNLSKRVVIAAYHRHNDENLLRNILNEAGFETKYSNGYMLSIWDDLLKAPYLRRGLIRAKK